MIQAEAKTAKEETIQALSKIGEGMKSNTATADKSTAVVEEVETMVHEAAEVEKTTAGNLKDIKNTGQQPGDNIALSYAAIAAIGTIAPKFQREVTVNIRCSLTVQTPSAMRSRNPNAHIERAIGNSGNEHIMNVRVMSSNQLESGDLSIKTSNNSKAQTLRTHADDWTYLIGAGATVRKPIYGVLAHGIRPNTMDINKFEEVKDKIGCLAGKAPASPRHG
ncbi:hypothetical protein LTR85_001006 [Meristemomyces frigidus]|nr:hypothetical protein LTR85_001006 [Meristemomyces frigidus]